MWVFILLLLVFSDVAVSQGELEKYGLFEILLYSNLLKCNHSKDLNLDVSKISVNFYDFDHDIDTTFKIKDAAKNIISLADNKHKTWVIYVPGFNSSVSDTSNSFIRESFRNLDDSYLVGIDHRALYTASVWSLIDSYEKAVSYVYDIAKAIASFLQDLTNFGIPVKSIKLIGHSLGAQILGYTGFHYKELTGNILHKITGIDPAGPCFSNSLIEDQIRSGAAEYVEIFHCNAGGLGTRSVLGDVDFFANDRGEFQPHCDVPLVPELLGSAKAAGCSHLACLNMYASTVNHRDWYLAWKCDSYKSFKDGNCDPNVTIAGFWSPGTAMSVYYFTSKVADEL